MWAARRTDRVFVEDLVGLQIYGDVYTYSHVFSDFM